MPNLHWLIVVSLGERKALAPVRGLEHFAFLMVMLSPLMLIMLAAYFWTRREQRLADLEVIAQKPSQEKASA